MEIQSSQHVRESLHGSSELQREVARGQYRSSKRRMEALRRVRAPGPWAAKWRARFHSRLEPIPTTGCWLWTGCQRDNGYGGTTATIAGRVEHLLTHRVAYALAHPEWDGQGGVLHACDVPLCCAPEHLRLGDAQENVTDAVKRGRIRRKGSIDRARALALLGQGESAASIAQAMGCSVMSVRRIGGAQ